MTSKLATRSKKIFQIMKKPAILTPLLVSVGIMLVGMCAALLVRPMPQSPDVNTQKAQFYQPEQTHKSTVYTYARARVVEVSKDYITVYVLDGKVRGQEKVVSLSPGTALHRLGETVIVNDSANDGSVTYQDVWRLPGVIIVVTMFVALAVLIAGWTGARSVLGLAISLVIIFGAIIPAIINGYSPVLVTAIGALIILGSSTLLAHGFRKRTFIALASIAVTLVLVAAVMYAVTILLHLGYMSDDDILMFQIGDRELDVSQVIVASMMIIALGVLDDIATAQVAVVDELRSVAKHLSFTELFIRAMSVGKEHVAALVNTISLTFVGASFPLAVGIVNDFHSKVVSESVRFNYTDLSTEIVRTFVPSMALLLAVPLSTLMAVWLLPKVWRKKKKIRTS